MLGQVGHASGKIIPNLARGTWTASGGGRHACLKHRRVTFNSWAVHLTDVGDGPCFGFFEGRCVVAPHFARSCTLCVLNDPVCWGHVLACAVVANGSFLDVAAEYSVGGGATITVRSSSIADATRTKPLYDTEHTAPPGRKLRRCFFRVYF